MYSAHASQCIFIYFGATRCDRRYYVIILLNVTLNTISVRQNRTAEATPFLLSENDLPHASKSVQQDEWKVFIGLHVRNNPGMLGVCPFCQ